MKTKFGIAIIILTWSISLSFGNILNSRSFDQPVELRSSDDLNTIAPVTPREAFFDEDMTGIELLNSFSSFAPLTPGEADFNENTTGSGEELMFLAPVTPREVDFNKDIEEPVISTGDDLKLLSPSAPKEADFNDNLVTF